MLIFWLLVLTFRTSRRAPTFRNRQVSPASRARRSVRNSWTYIVGCCVLVIYVHQLCVISVSRLPTVTFRKSEGIAPVAF